MLADLKPGFIRFPGGCIVEGIMLSNRFQWKHSIGVELLMGWMALAAIVSSVILAGTLVPARFARPPSDV